jgi:hypothetical protein
MEKNIYRQKGETNKQTPKKNNKNKQTKTNTQTNIK